MKAFHGVNEEFKPFVAVIVDWTFGNSSVDIGLQYSTISRVVKGFNVSINPIFVDIPIDLMLELEKLILIDRSQTKRKKLEAYHMRSVADRWLTLKLISQIR